MKKLMMVTVAAFAVTAALAAPRAKKGVQAMAGNEDGPVTSGKEAEDLRGFG